MHPKVTPININDLPGATTGSIKMSGFTTESRKPDWSTEELDEPGDDT